MADVQLRATRIRKLFGRFAALDGIDIDIERGELLTLLGPSGSGKTTFLMILAGLIAPSSGRLEEAGIDITDRKSTRLNSSQECTSRMQSSVCTKQRMSRRTESTLCMHLKI